MWKEAVLLQHEGRFSVRKWSGKREKTHLNRISIVLSAALSQQDSMKASPTAVRALEIRGEGDSRREKGKRKLLKAFEGGAGRGKRREGRKSTRRYSRRRLLLRPRRDGRRRLQPLTAALKRLLVRSFSSLFLPFLLFIALLPNQLSPFPDAPTYAYRPSTSSFPSGFLPDLTSSSPRPTLSPNSTLPKAGELEGPETFKTRGSGSE